MKRDTKMPEATQERKPLHERSMPAIASAIASSECSSDIACSLVVAAQVAASEGDHGVAHCLADLVRAVARRSEELEREQELATYRALNPVMKLVYDWADMTPQVAP